MSFGSIFLNYLLIQIISSYITVYSKFSNKTQKKSHIEKSLSKHKVPTVAVSDYVKMLSEQKSITGYGVENAPDKINACIINGVSVIQQDIDDGIHNYKGMGFDVAVMASSIQCLRKPRDAMKNILKVANECVITLPNFGNWELRLGILNGKMPSSAQLPAKWYETKNLHLCTIADFEELCREESFAIKKNVYCRS